MAATLSDDARLTQHPRLSTARRTDVPSTAAAAAATKLKAKKAAEKNRTKAAKALVTKVIEEALKAQTAPISVKIIVPKLVSANPIAIFF